MKNYLNRMAVMALALMLAVCVPLAVGAEDVAEDVYVQGEDMSLTETEVVSEIPAVSASVRITSLNLGRCEYFGDSLSLKANLENADGTETVVWQVCTNYVEGGNNTWTQFGTGTVASVNITPAIGQCAYRCVLSTGAVSREYRVEKTFAARPEEVDTATEETETETEETVVETEATVPADENETAAETVTESAEELPENQETEETNPVETEEVEFEDIFEDVVVFEDEFEFEDEEWLEFDDNDWGSSDSDFFSALDELANNYEENAEETEEVTAEETVAEAETEEAAEEVAVEAETEENTEEVAVEAETEENTEEVAVETETEEKRKQQNLESLFATGDTEKEKQCSNNSH